MSRVLGITAGFPIYRDELSGNISSMAPRIGFEPLLIANSSREREHIMKVIRNVKIFS